MIWLAELHQTARTARANNKQKCGWPYIQFILYIYYQQENTEKIKIFGHFTTTRNCCWNYCCSCYCRFKITVVGYRSLNNKSRIILYCFYYMMLYCIVCCYTVQCRSVLWYPVIYCNAFCGEVLCCIGYTKSMQFPKSLSKDLK